MFSVPLPGLDEPVAGICYMFHLEVESCVHGSQDQTVFEVQTGGVHKVQQNGKNHRVHLGV